MAKERKKTELDLYNKWKKTKNPTHFKDLYGSMKNLIYDAARKASYGSNVPESAHRAWAAQNFLDSLRTYNPTKGAALQTHVYNAVHQKAKRLNYMYQNLGSMPEPRAQSVGTYQTGFEYLKSSLGREPSSAEIADHLGWSLKMVTDIRKEIRKDLSMDAGVGEQAFTISSTDDEVLNYLYYELNPQEQVVYDHIFGKHGKQRMIKPNKKIDFDRIAKTTGVSTSKVRNIFGKIRIKLKKALFK